MMARPCPPQFMGIERLRHGRKKHKRNTHDRQGKPDSLGSRKLRFTSLPTHFNGLDATFQTNSETLSLIAENRIFTGIYSITKGRLERFRSDDFAVLPSRLSRAALNSPRFAAGTFG